MKTGYIVFSAIFYVWSSLGKESKNVYLFKARGRQKKKKWNPGVSVLKLGENVDEKIRLPFLFKQFLEWIKLREVYFTNFNDGK